MELPRLARPKGCFAAYDVRGKIDELSGRNTGRLGDIRQDTAHAIGGTAELAPRHSIISTFSAGPKHHSVMTMGWPRLLEHGQRRSTHRGHRTVHGTTDRPEQRMPPPTRRRRRTFQGLLASLEQRTPTPTPPRLQYLPNDCGPDGDADGLCRSTPRHAEDSTTRPSGTRIGPTRQSDARDSESSSICQGLTRSGPGTFKF